MYTRIKRPKNLTFNDDQLLIRETCDNSEQYLYSSFEITSSL